MTATITRASGQQEDITKSAQWSSTVDGVASVAEGMVTAKGAGTCEVLAAFNGMTPRISVAVTGGSGTGTGSGSGGSGSGGSGSGGSGNGGDGNGGGTG